MAVQYVTDGGPDGAIIGQTSLGLIGFYGKTPAVRYATSIAAPSSVASVSVSATQWGFATSTQANAIITTVAKLQELIVGTGLASST
jgi:UDP-N-acetyl-D-mannosaminuronic acid transferase (WecB/TagA/CpsF family)